MKSPTEFNPLSISERVRERVEARAKGTIPLAEGPSSGNTKACTSSTRGDPGDHLADEFTNLIFGQYEEKLNSRSQQFHRTPADDYSQRERVENGTNQNFLPPNKCEERKQKDNVSSIDFVISNSEAGAVEVHARMLGSVLKVKLKFQTGMSDQSQRVLQKILASRLTNELGVKVEIQID